jgi:small conductance mechanosensitive channel
MMIQKLVNFLSQVAWLSELHLILIYFGAALVFSLLMRPLSKYLLLLGNLAPRDRKLRPERQKTLQFLLSSAITLFSLIAAALASLALFIQADTLAWMVGLFSAAFGLGARPLIGDYLAGISFIFEDTFAVGEKIEFPGLGSVEGLIENINLRTTAVRAPSGELFVVPNGEIRTVRNFSRGKFSQANIMLRIPSSELARALPMLEDLGVEAVVLLPNLLEPWHIVSESGVIGEYTELTLVTKTRFGKASEMRPRLLTLVQERLNDIEIPLVS